MIVISTADQEASMASARRMHSETGVQDQASFEKVIQAFVGSVSKLDHVYEVLTEDTPDGPQVWTVIDAESLEFAPCKPVYDAELQATLIAPGAKVFFRLINRREYCDDEIEWAIPQQAHVAWRRP
jgi:hypothetical protein